MKQIGVPPQTVSTNIPVKFIPVFTGASFAPQLITVICISRTTVPIGLPFLHSVTSTHITPTSIVVGNIEISPVTGSIVTVQLGPRGAVAEYPALYVTGEVLLVCLQSTNA